MAVGINLVCADRVGESIMPVLTVRENLFLNPIAAGKGVFSFLAPGSENRASLELGREVGLRPNVPSLPIELLSGGNQQKVVVGRWLHLGAKLYIFEDPTAGVDVGAKAEIYRLFDVALQNGAAILIVSTDFEEVAKVCHRAIVFDRGRVVAELGAADLSVENLAGRGFGQYLPFGRNRGLGVRGTNGGLQCSPLSPAHSSRPAPSLSVCHAGGRWDGWRRFTACRS